MSEPFVARQRIRVLLAAQLVPVVLAVALVMTRPGLHVAPELRGYFAGLWALQLIGLLAAARFIEREEIFRLVAGAIVVFAGVPLNGLLIYAFTAH